MYTRYSQQTTDELILTAYETLNQQDELALELLQRLEALHSEADDTDGDT